MSAPSASVLRTSSSIMKRSHRSPAAASPRVTGAESVDDAKLEVVDTLALPHLVRERDEKVLRAPFRGRPITVVARKPG